VVSQPAPQEADAVVDVAHQQEVLDHRQAGHQQRHVIEGCLHQGQHGGRRGCGGTRGGGCARRWGRGAVRGIVCASGRGADELQGAPRQETTSSWTLPRALE